MPFSNKPISSITEDDLNDLIVNQVAEGKTIDYKVTLPGNSDDKKKDFLADVSSFANTAGGHLIYGMDEKHGMASSLPGLSDIDPDKEILRLESIIRDGMAPRIAGISIRPIQLNNGNLALIIHIPKSWLSPHMITFQRLSKFYTRASNGQYQMDVQEIRQAFLLSETIAERIRNFRLDRLALIRAEETPISLTGKARLVVHVIPLSSFQTFHSVDLSQISQNFYEYLKDSASRRFNIDGFIAFREKTSTLARSYYQVFRAGHVEFASGNLTMLLDGEQEVIPSRSAEEDIINACNNMLNLLKACEIEPPIFVFVSLITVKGLVFAKNPSMRSFDPSFFDRDTILIPELFLGNYPLEKDNLASQLKPVMDALWNAAGLSGSPNYNNDGLWRPR